MACNRIMSSTMTLLLVTYLVILIFKCDQASGFMDQAKAGATKMKDDGEKKMNNNASDDANANANAGMNMGKDDEKKEEKKDKKDENNGKKNEEKKNNGKKEEKKDNSPPKPVPQSSCTTNKCKFPPGYKEIILAISAFCVSDEDCMAAKVQNHLYKCLKDENGKKAKFVSQFYDCIGTETDFCDAKSVESFQSCVQYLGEHNANEINIPQTNRYCMRDDLSLRTMECLRSKFPSLGRLFPLSADPKEKN